MYFVQSTCRYRELAGCTTHCDVSASLANRNLERRSSFFKIAEQFDVTWSHCTV